MYVKEELKNGVSLITSRLDGTRAVTVLVFIKVGTRFEEKNEAGIAHFIEHLLFKGTNKRPTTLDISKELDSVGAEYNAFTGKDYTGLYIKLDAKHIKMALDMISDLIYNSTFVESEIDKERAVIIEEINMYEDTPMYLLEELLENQFYGDHPLGKNILGTKESINSITQEQIKNFHNKHYVNGNITISISGKLPEDIKSLTKEYFQKDESKENSFDKIKNINIAKPVNIYYKETEQVHLALGLPLDVNYKHEDNYYLKIANIIFGGSMSSRLFINIRENEGLGYYINSGINLYEDTANWAVYAGVDKSRLEDALKLIKIEWQNLLKGVNEEEFKQAKEFFKGKLILRFEDSSQVAQWYGKQELFELPIETSDEIIKKIDSLELKNLNKILENNIKLEKLILSLVGPFKDENKFINLIK